MKVTLEFDTSDIDQKDEFDLINQATNMSNALWEIQQYLRDSKNYTEPSPTIDEIYSKYYEIINECGVTL